MDDERLRRFTWIYATGAVVLVLVTISAVAFAVQEHNDRVLSEELTETASELQDTGARITSIRDAQMKSMDDYVRAFSEIGPLG
jgi:DNA-binding FrmR family transcriptional regulator